jgi:hypothetical protein
MQHLRRHLPNSSVMIFANLTETTRGNFHGALGAELHMLTGKDGKERGILLTEKAHGRCMLLFAKEIW